MKSDIVGEGGEENVEMEREFWGEGFGMPSPLMGNSGFVDVSDSTLASAPERQRAHAVGAPEMSAEMRLIGKTGFGRHVHERETFLRL